MTEMNRPLAAIAADVVSKATHAGATGVECVIREGSEFSVTVRVGEVESLKEAGSKAMGLRVLVGQRSGSSYTSDFSDAGVSRLVDSAVSIARLTSEDPFAGLPDPATLGSFSGDLHLFYDDVHSVPTPDRIDIARRMEKAALAEDPRIGNSEGASFEAGESRMILANSLGFCGEYRRSRISIAAVPVAGSEGALERDYWSATARSFAALPDAEEVGRIAARRALRRLGSRKIPTCRVPVIFEQRMAVSLLGALCAAVSGDAVYRRATYLAGKLNSLVAAPSVTVVDDGLRPSGLGSSPFDDEGVPSRRTVIVENGVLKSYLLNSYAGRKLGMPTTGNASRNLTGSPGIGAGNFYLQPGEQTPEEICRTVSRGLLVTELIGSGVNLVTGDYSQGAAGLWIENGEPAYPVSEITVAGNLLDMWRNIEMIGSDLEFQSAVAAPTLKIAEMTVAGS
jgi:PmbA protein